MSSQGFERYSSRIRGLDPSFPTNDAMGRTLSLGAIRAGWLRGAPGGRHPKARTRLVDVGGDREMMQRTDAQEIVFLSEEIKPLKLRLME
jgi:hypothetical protein